MDALDPEYTISDSYEVPPIYYEMIMQNKAVALSMLRWALMK